MRHSARVAPTPLFDRLVSGDDGTSGVGAALDLDGLKASVRYELSRVLVSRHRRHHRDLFSERTSIEFGVSDHYLYDTRLARHRELLAEELEGVIRAFEPRLEEPSVEVFEPGDLETATRITITGYLRVGNVLEPLSFRVTQRAQFLEVKA